jgi:hypothetical protein
MAVRVFISYAHSDLQTPRVRAFADFLKGNGISVVTDLDVNDPAGPAEGWLAWMRRQVEEADFVLIMFDRVYRSVYEGTWQGKGKSGSGFEGRLITAHLYTERLNRRFVALHGDEESPDEVLPLEIRTQFNFYSIPRDQEVLANRLLGRVGAAPAITVGQDDVRRVWRSLFFSEFDEWPFLQSLLTEPRRTLGLVAVWMIIASVPIVLGALALANCMEAHIRDSANQRRVEVMFGYLAEPNHGWYYLFGVPLLIFGAFSLLAKAEQAFRAFALTDKLTLLDEKNRVVGGDKPERRKAVIDAIAYWNRKMGILLIGLAPALALALILVQETPSVCKRWFGWVQAEHVVQLNGLPFSQLEGSIIHDVVATWRKPQWEGRFTREQMWEDLRKDTNLNLTIELKRPLPTDESANKIRRWSSSFVSVALLVESAALALIIWFAIKSLIIVWLLLSAQWTDGSTPGVSVALHSRLVRGLGRRAHVQLALNFEDEDRRFGIGRLDQFNLAVVIVGALVAVVYFLGRLSNLAKGTAWPASPELLMGQLLIPFAIVTACLAVCLYPTWHLWGPVGKLRREKALAASGQPERLKRIESQKLWPGWRKGYVAVAWVVASLIVALPLFVEPALYFIAGDAGAAAVVKAGRLIQRIACSAFHSL